MPKIRHKTTGLVHEVPEGHYGLKSARFERLDEDRPEAADTVPAEPKPEPARRVRNKQNA